MSQTNFVTVHQELSLIVWYIKPISLPLGLIEPLSRSTKGPHGQSNLNYFPFSEDCSFMLHLFAAQLIRITNFKHFFCLTDGTCGIRTTDQVQVLAFPTVQPKPRIVPIPHQLEACGDQTPLGSHLLARRRICSQ